MDIAALDVKGHGDVAFLVVVDQRRAGLHCFFSIENSGQRLPFDIDQSEGFFGDIQIHGRDSGDLFANITSFPDR